MQAFYHTFQYEQLDFEFENIKNTDLKEENINVIDLSTFELNYLSNCIIEKEQKNIDLIDNNIINENINNYKSDLWKDMGEFK